jgi:short-subunit dehydrogenase
MAPRALVTGASSGIGQAYAQRLGRDGWELVLVARRRDRLEALAADLREAHGVAVRVLDLDLGDPAKLQELVREVEASSLDMLVNNAALAHYAPFADLDPSRAAELVHINTLAPVLLTRAAVGGMRDRGRGAVVNVASLLAFSGSADAPHLPARAVYAATKSFLVTFTCIVATEMRGTGVKLQVVCPGVVRSEFHSRQGMDMSAVPRMEPDDVVEASLVDLGRGQVVCIPGLAELDPLERLDAVERELTSADVVRVRELPARFR